MTSPTLPEEFVLLLQKDNGSYYSTSDYTGAAELGELVLRHRVEFVGKKIQVLDASPSGIGWLDESMTFLVKKAGAANKPVAAPRFVQHRRGVRKVHCAALAERGLMRREQKSALFIPYDKYFPDAATRQALIAEIRGVARGEVELDNRRALLAALVHATNLVRALGPLERAERKRLKEISKGEQLGKTVEAVVAAATAAITTGAVSAATAGAAGS